MSECRYCERGVPLIDAGFLCHPMPPEEAIPDLRFKGILVPPECQVVACETLAARAESIHDALSASTWRTIIDETGEDSPHA